MKKLLILAITLCSSLFTVDAADKKGPGGLRESAGREPVEKFLSRQVILIRQLPCLGYEFLDATDRKDGRRLGVHIRRGQDPWFQADSPTQPLDQRLRTVCHYARYR